MSNISKIPVGAPWRRLCLAGALACTLAACGQKGDLFVPTGAAAAGRATLPQSLNPLGSPASSPAGTTPLPGGGPATPVTAPPLPPAGGTASPLRTP